MAERCNRGDHSSVTIKAVLISYCVTDSVVIMISTIVAKGLKQHFFNNLSWRSETEP